MIVKELKDQCEKIIKEGGENSHVYFDTEAMCFDCHWVKVKDIYYFAIDVLDSEASTVMSFDPKEELYHYNKD
jgi:hypothetical protein